MQGDIIITSDSRAVVPGAVFIAIKGTQCNGNNYILKAIKCGARCIVTEKYPEELGFVNSKLIDSSYEPVETIATFEIFIEGKVIIWDVVKNSRLSYSRWAKQMYSSQPDNVVAVTGTNGKTSTVSFVQQILAIQGINSASIGTVGIRSSVEIPKQIEVSLTTPDALSMHKLLGSLKSYGIEHIALEASSHALDQHRLSSIDIKAAAFTNFSQDHLDYHVSMENYLEAKTKLFSEVLSPGQPAVLNKSILEFSKLADVCKNFSHPIISYGGTGADITYQDKDGIIDINITGEKYSTVFNVIGDFQRYNLMAAIGLLTAMDIKGIDIVKSIPHLRAPDGRMEFVTEYNGAKIFIDYAHTPDALERALIALKPLASKGKLSLVFGCGGDRDHSKRFLMGSIADKEADIIFVTDDNPRTEKASVIRDEIVKGCTKAYNIPSRDKAIEEAISYLKPGDVLLVAGKGHEEYQIIGDEKVLFSDKKHILKFVNGMEI